jgi:hypothetical protein
MVLELEEVQLKVRVEETVKEVMVMLGQMKVVLVRVG